MKMKGMKFWNLTKSSNLWNEKVIDNSTSTNIPQFAAILGIHATHACPAFAQFGKWKTALD